jgi:hypothetical protein
MTQSQFELGQTLVGHPSVSRKHCLISQHCVCKVVSNLGNVWRKDKNGHEVKCSTGDEFLAEGPVFVYKRTNGDWISFSLYQNTSNGVYGKNQELLHENAKLRKQLAVHKLTMMRARAEKRAEKKEYERRKLVERRLLLIRKYAYKQSSTLQKLQKKINQLQEKIAARESTTTQACPMLGSDDEGWE